MEHMQNQRDTVAFLIGFVSGLGQLLTQCDQTKNIRELMSATEQFKKLTADPNLDFARERFEDLRAQMMRGDDVELSQATISQAIDALEAWRMDHSETPYVSLVSPGSNGERDPEEGERCDQ